ncbi:hypothetical protein VNO78_27531 [Psophocarpus tetragonolobus]|uniref:Uncharacterized protein n=1 Tax=Psophocarpus tetragonolobus TaxID=3891 RepID=A0AAN9S1M2_PSOTE
MMSKRGRRPKTPPTWIMHWDIRVKKRPNSDRVDKTYRHKVEGFQCRSLIEVARYETQGIRPRRSKVKTKDKEESRSRTKTVTKEMLVAERKEAAEDMRPIVEDFLSQAHYKQIHMVKPRATESAMLYM